MKNAHQRKRIGLVLASLHTGSSLKLWSQLALDAAQSTDPFFIFPGGRLVNKFQTDNLRNAIYDLVNTDNLDGLISWASSIGGGVSFEELRKFHSDFSPLPYVTIGQKITTKNDDKIEEHPCVDFDAYYGMKSLIRHFIDVHKAKKIAFLHGPANHQSALDRYRAYVDVVRSAGYSDSEIRELVSSPCSWYEGEKAIRELVELRKLVPGKDFDVIIASSDMMALSAINWLNTQGIKVPRDVLLGGFNDSVESNITSSPFSTVHMPYEELGIIANRMIHELLDGNKDVSDSTLETELLIRESCGCNSAKTWPHTLESQNQVNTSSQLADEFASVFGLSSQDRKMLVLPLVHDFESGDSVSFFNRFGNLVFNYLKAGHDVNNLFKITDIIYKTSYINDEYINRVLPYID
ncbi:MAG: LacI family transcriptional regulator, partial [Treponema sp.]|nr:LacI family transcriptional regulator [Treponema sp.]